MSVEQTNDQTGSDTALLSLWQSLTQPIDTVPAASRDAYQQRLRTFRPSTYFAKPVSLSPLIAARFGWTNPSRDMLVCCECHAALMVTLNPNLSVCATESLCRTYKRRLATSHASDCPFRLDAERHLLSAPSNPRGNDIRYVVSACFASVLPQDTVQLMELPDPRDLLQRRMMELMDTSNDITAGPWQIPKLILSKDVQNFATSQGDPAATISAKGESLACRVSNALVVDGSETDSQSAAMLALFGWSPVAASATEHPPRENGPPTMAVQCVVCLSRKQLILEKSEDEGATPAKKVSTAQFRSPTRILIESPSTDEEDEEKAPPAKRPRILEDIKEQRGMNPLSSHRHYCPFVCGFLVGAASPSTPAWQAIVTNLFRSVSSSDETNAGGCNKGEETLRVVQRILRSGIA